MNMSANESEYGILSFYYFIYLCFICFSDFMINFLLNLGCNVSGYFSPQNEMATFLNSWEILLYRFIMSNITMSVSGLVFLWYGI